MNDELTIEQVRVLRKRIRVALDKVKYYPASHDIDTLADEVLAPYKPRTVQGYTRQQAVLDAMLRFDRYYSTQHQYWKAVCIHGSTA